MAVEFKEFGEFLHRDYKELKDSIVESLVLSLAKNLIKNGFIKVEEQIIKSPFCEGEDPRGEDRVIVSIKLNA
jgi:hypothetical protein